MNLQGLFGVLQDLGHSSDGKPKQVDLHLGAARYRVGEDSFVDTHQLRVVVCQQFRKVATRCQPGQLAALVGADVDFDVQQSRSRAGAAVSKVKLRCEAS